MKCQQEIYRTLDYSPTIGQHPILHNAMFYYCKVLMISATKIFYSLVQGALLVFPERWFLVKKPSNWAYIKVYQPSTDERDLIQFSCAIKCQGILFWIHSSQCKQISFPSRSSFLSLICFTFRQEPMTYFPLGFQTKGCRLQKISQNVLKLRHSQ